MFLPLHTTKPSGSFDYKATAQIKLWAMDHSASVTRKSEANFVNSCELQYALIIVPLERILRLTVPFGVVSHVCPRVGFIPIFTFSKGLQVCLNSYTLSCGHLVKVTVGFTLVYLHFWGNAKETAKSAKHVSVLVRQSLACSCGAGRFLLCCACFFST